MTFQDDTVHAALDEINRTRQLVVEWFNRMGVVHDLPEILAGLYYTAGEEEFRPVVLARWEYEGHRYAGTRYFDEPDAKLGISMRITPRFPVQTLWCIANTKEQIGMALLRESQQGPVLAPNV
jgi:hypothetical protein